MTRLLFAFLYQRFAFAAFMSGIIGGVGSGFIAQPRPTDILTGCLHIASSALLAWLHGLLAEIDAKALAAYAASGHIVELSLLHEEQLALKRRPILALLTSAGLLFVLAAFTSGGGFARVLPTWMK